MDSVTGKVLIAIPELPDSNFFRTVVFMLEHTDEGAMGVVLNRPTNLDLISLWSKLDPEVQVTRASEPVYLGGPVEGPVIALHDQYGIADEEVITGVFMSMTSTRLNQLVVLEGAQLKVFSGYSGWGPGQLELELDSGGWLISEVSAADVFNVDEELWKQICDRYGRQILFDKLLPESPQIDPNLN